MWSKVFVIENGKEKHEKKKELANHPSQLIIILPKQESSNLKISEKIKYERK